MDRIDMAADRRSAHLDKAASSGRRAMSEAIAAGVSAAKVVRAATDAAGHGPESPRQEKPPSAPGKPPRPRAVGFLAPKSKVGAKAAKTRNRASPKRARAAAARNAAKPAPLTATGWLMLAGVILAWPREREAHGIEGRIARGPVGLGDRLRAEMSTPSTTATDLAQAEPGRGRDAQTPAQIPPRAWREVLARAWTEFNADRITAVAGGVTFFSLLALFPAMAAFVSLYGLFADTKDVGDHLRVLAGVVPGDALKFIGEQMVRMAQTHGSTLSFTFVTTLLISLWSANSGVKALFDGLNVAYEQKESRGFVKLNLISLAFTLGAILFLALAAASVIAVPVVLGLVGFKLGGLAPVLDLARWPVLLAGVALGLAVVYRYGPSRARPKWVWITPGGAAAAVFWLLASMLFSFYVSHFGSYNKTYGSLGAVVGFMTWMWISIIVVLFGAEINAELEHQTAADTTTGAPRPLGQRGAKMADEVANPSAPKKAS